MSIILNEEDIRSLIRRTLQEQRFSLVVTAGSDSSSFSDGSSGGRPISLGQTSIKSGVKWGPGDGGQKRKVAWSVLSHFLPDGAVLTSCYRDQADQDRIIKNFANEYNYSGPNNLDRMHKFIKSKGLIVARKVGKGHGGKSQTGAFDISGADLDAIWEGVEAANSDSLRAVIFKKLKQGSIIERKNNAVHVQFSLSAVSLEKCKQFIREEQPEGAVSDSGTSSKGPSSIDQVTFRGRVKIKNAAQGQEYSGSKYTAVVSGAKQTFIKLPAGKGGAAFKRIKAGEPSFGGAAPTFARLKGEEEKEILRRLS